MAWSTIRIRRSRADSMVSGACTNGSTARRLVAMSAVSGGATVINTLRGELHRQQILRCFASQDDKGAQVTSMRMPSQQAMALMTCAMMVAMMLPSVAPTLWRYHRHLRAMRTPQVGQRTSLFAAGYASVWSAIGLLLFGMNAALPPFAPSALGVLVLRVGVVQRSRWKAKQLLRCREACVEACSVPTNVITAWREGCELGFDCALSCAGPMTVLLVGGLMDPRVMLSITALIPAERVTPA